MNLKGWPIPIYHKIKKVWRKIIQFHENILIILYSVKSQMCRKMFGPLMIFFFICIVIISIQNYAINCAHKNLLAVTIVVAVGGTTKYIIIVINTSKSSCDLYSDLLLGCQLYFSYILKPNNKSDWWSLSDCIVTMLQVKISYTYSDSYYK